MIFKFKYRDPFFIYIFLLTLALIVPKIGSVDNVSARWLSISFINLSFFTYIYFIKGIKYLVFNRPTQHLTSIAIISLISFLYSNNLSEAILFSSKVILITFTMYNLSICVNNSKNTFENIIFSLGICLVYEIIYVVGTYLILGNEFITGVSMNPNISSFSILIKIPVIFYLHQKTNRFTWYLYIIEILALISLYILQSRASIPALGLIYASTLFIGLDDRKRKLMNFVKLALLVLFVFFSRTSLNITNTFNNVNILNDDSFLLRLEYYSLSINSILKNILLGNGGGSWKIESLREFTQNYDVTIVPYYVHNDFLQFFYELGIFAFIAYILFFYSIYNNARKTPHSYKGFFIISLLVFLLDSFVNFPFHRPQEIITILILSAPIIKNKIFNEIRFKNFYFKFLTLILILTTFIQLKEHESLRLQDILISDSLSDSYNIAYDDLRGINSSLPNISVNTIPIDTYISRYFLYNKDLPASLKYSKNGYKINPHLKYTKEIYLRSLLLSKNFDESLEVSRLLYNQDRSNEVYAETFLSLLITNNKFIEIEKLFYQLIDDNMEQIVQQLLLEYSKLSIKNPIFLDSAIKLSLENYPDNSIIKKLSE